MEDYFDHIPRGTSFHSPVVCLSYWYPCVKLSRALSTITMKGSVHEKGQRGSHSENTNPDGQVS